MSASGGHLSASGGHLSAADIVCRRTLSGGPWRTIFQNSFGGHWRTLADFFLADCPRVDGGPDRIRSDPPRTLADFLSPHKVRLGPPESAKRKSSADTGADSSGQWRTQADPIGSAADSGGQLSASFSANKGDSLKATTLVPVIQFQLHFLLLARLYHCFLLHDVGPEYSILLNDVPH